VVDILSSNVAIGMFYDLVVKGKKKNHGVIRKPILDSLGPQDKNKTMKTSQNCKGDD
jgi:hypothetical protein